MFVGCWLLAKRRQHRTQNDTKGDSKDDIQVHLPTEEGEPFFKEGEEDELKILDDGSDPVKPLEYGLTPQAEN